MPLKAMKIKVYEKANSTQHGTGSLKGSVQVSYKTKLQYSGQMMQRADSQERTLMLAKIEGRRRRGRQRMRRLDGITDLMVSVLWFGCFRRYPLSRKTKAGRTDSQSLSG